MTVPSWDDSAVLNATRCGKQCLSQQKPGSSCPFYQKVSLVYCPTDEIVEPGFILVSHEDYIGDSRSLDISTAIFSPCI